VEIELGVFGGRDAVAMCAVAPRRFELAEIHTFIHKNNHKIGSWLPAAVHASITDLERVVAESVSVSTRPRRGHHHRHQAPTWQNKNWENFRSFKPTKVLTSETPVSRFRTAYNKMTDATMDKTMAELGTLIDESSDVPALCADLADVVLTGTAASPGNADLYARFIRMCQADGKSVMAEAVMTKLRAECVKKSAKAEPRADDSYDALCTANAANDKNTAFLRLAVLCERHGVLSPGSTALLLKKLSGRLAKLGASADDKPEAEVLVARLIGALEALGGRPSEAVDASIEIVLANCEKRREYPGLGNKVLFTLLDYRDTLGALAD
jgi:hypothetical protein